MANFQDNGFDKLLRRVGSALIGIPNSGPATGSPVTASLPAERIVSGDLSDPIYSGKRDFQDNVHDGYRLGIDPKDHVFKFLIGGPSGEISWNSLLPNSLVAINTGTTYNAALYGITRGFGPAASFVVENGLNRSPVITLEQRATPEGPFWRMEGWTTAPGATGGSMGPPNVKTLWQSLGDPNGSLNADNIGDFLLSAEGKAYVAVGGTVWTELGNGTSVPTYLFAAAFGVGFNDLSNNGTATASNLVTVAGPNAGATGFGAASLASNQGFVFTSFAQNPSFSTLLSNIEQNGSIDVVWTIFCGLHDAQASYTNVSNHIGFKMIYDIASDSYKVYATQANGTTETASALLLSYPLQAGGVGGGQDTIEFSLTCISDVSTRYRVVRHGANGDVEATVTLSTHMPDSTLFTAGAEWFIGNSVISAGGPATAYFSSVSYSR